MYLQHTKTVLCNFRAIGMFLGTLINICIATKDRLIIDELLHNQHGYWPLLIRILSSFFHKTPLLVTGLPTEIRLERLHYSRNYIQNHLKFQNRTRKFTLSANESLYDVEIYACCETMLRHHFHDVGGMKQMFEYVFLVPYHFYIVYLLNFL